MPKEKILEQFRLFSLGGDGIGGWLTEKTDDKIFERIDKIQDHPLSRAQLNQLLVLGHQAPVSDGFFQYYWLESPTKHPYRVEKLPGFCQGLERSSTEISSLRQLECGLYRLFVDALLYFGNVRTAFRTLRPLDREQLRAFFEKKRIDTVGMKARGSELPLQTISQDDRYLVSEQACKSFGESTESESEMLQALKQAYHQFRANNRGDATVTFRQLLTGNLAENYSDRQPEFAFAIDDILDESISSDEEFDRKFGRAVDRYFAARRTALANTDLYLSMVSDLDVYVATSMRNRRDFREISKFCDDVFRDQSLADLGLRYFDPTLSAARGHEDKGLIECLMVKCAKVLVYFAGQSDSYGKGAEAAMALSLGMPVIFYCDKEEKKRGLDSIVISIRLVV